MSILFFVLNNLLYLQRVSSWSSASASPGFTHNINLKTYFMGYKFVSSDVKFGISLDRKSFCVITKDGVDFYSDIDEFLSMWKSLILKIIEDA